MLTRDIKLEKAIIDLIDNSIDGAINNATNDDLSSFVINIDINSDHFSIKDNCGGISLAVAKQYAFKFGRPEEVPEKVGNIGQFGIGMKRTIFKLGKNCFFESKSEKSKFSFDLDIEEWKDEDTWIFDLNAEELDEVSILSDRYTNITITHLYPSVSESFSTQNFLNELKIEIENAHAYSLAKGIQININSVPLTYTVPKLKENENIGILAKEFFYNEGTEDEVKVTIYAGMTDRDLTNSGWYIYCNDRLLVSSNKNMTTGWGSNDARKFHQDYAYFRGYVFFESKNGDKLPWTTTKDGINFNSDIYQSILLHMQTEVKPILDLLKDLGKETTLFNKDPERIERKIYNTIEKLLNEGSEIGLRTIDSQQVLKIPNFSLPSPRKIGTITFSRPLEELNDVKEFLGVSTNKEVGLYSYRYFIENEME